AGGDRRAVAAPVGVHRRRPGLRPGCPGPARRPALRGRRRAAVAVAVLSSAPSGRQPPQPQGRRPSAAATIHLRYRILNMKIALLVIVPAVVLASAAPPLAAQQPQQAAQPTTVTAKIAEQLKRMQDDLDKNSVTMGETQRRNREREFADVNREFQRKQREFREDLNQRRNEELAQVVEMANRVIRQIAEQEKFDII